MNRYFTLGWRHCLLLLVIGMSSIGSAALTQQEYQQLVEAYDQLQQDPQDALIKVHAIQQKITREPLEIRAKVTYLLVEIYQHLGQWDAAIQHLLALQQQIPIKNPLYLTGETWLIYLYYQQQAYPSCVTQGHKVLEQDSAVLAPQKQAETSMLLAYCYYHQRQFKSALYWSEQANQLSATPNEAWLRFSLSLYQHLQQWQNAANLIEQRLLAVAPQEKIYWQSLVSAYLQLKQYAAALSVMELMPKYIPFDQALYMQQIYLYRLMLLPYQAAIKLRDGLESGAIPKNRAHYLLLIELLVQARNRIEAIHYLDELLNSKVAKSASQRADLLFKRSSLAIQQGDWKLLQLSLLDAKHYLSHLNDNWTLWLARTFIQQEAWLQAEATLESLQQPDNGQAQALLNYIHFMNQPQP